MRDLLDIIKRYWPRPVGWSIVSFVGPLVVIGIATALLIRPEGGKTIRVEAWLPPNAQFFDIGGEVTPVPLATFRDLDLDQMSVLVYRRPPEDLRIIYYGKMVGQDTTYKAEVTAAETGFGQYVKDHTVDLENQTITATMDTRLVHASGGLLGLPGMNPFATYTAVAARTGFAMLASFFSFVIFAERREKKQT